MFLNVAQKKQFLCKRTWIDGVPRKPSFEIVVASTCVSFDRKAAGNGVELENCSIYTVSYMN